TTKPSSVPSWPGSSLGPRLLRSLRRHRGLLHLRLGVNDLDRRLGLLRLGYPVRERSSYEKEAVTVLAAAESHPPEAVTDPRPHPGGINARSSAGEFYGQVFDGRSVRTSESVDQRGELAPGLHRPDLSLGLEREGFGHPRSLRGLGGHRLGRRSV